MLAFRECDSSRPKQNPNLDLDDSSNVRSLDTGDAFCVVLSAVRGYTYENFHDIYGHFPSCISVLDAHNVLNKFACTQAEKQTLTINKY